MALYFPVATEFANPPIAAIFSKDIPRSLVTAYPFVLGHKSPKVLAYYMAKTSSKAMILDSGIYTLYKDMMQGGKVDEKFLDGYIKKYLGLIKSIGWKHPFVEIDCQNIIPGRLVDKYRKIIEDAGYADQSIFVWHTGDGPDNFSEICRKYKRISIGAREFVAKGLKVDNFIQILRRDAEYVNKCHVHCLGTSTDVVTCRPDNFSFDTSSWNTVAVFGETKAGNQSVSYKKGKLTAPPYIMERVKKNMDHMIEVYRKHPEYTAGSKVRWQYIAQMAAALYLTVDYFESIRKKTPFTDSSVVDPLDYPKIRKEKHAGR